MFFRKKENFHPAEILSRTLFLTSLVSFVVFLGVDLIHPGFVSRTFSVHWFLLVAIVSGFLWGSMVKNKK